MSLLILIVTLFTSSVVSQVQVPCYGEGCANVTVYLGPRWGSRVIIVPRGTSTIRPVANGTDNDVEVRVSEDRLEQFDKRYPRPQHKPITQDEEFQVDFMDDERPSPTTQSTGGLFPWLGWTTTRRQEFRNSITNDPDHNVRIFTDKFGRGTLDLSSRGYTGEEVKQALKTLTQYDRRQATKLILDGNRIHVLPVLVFPVEFEYNLQELSLADNSFSPPYLTSYTKFELSRLGRLMTLNMSRCGLRSIEIPDLPSLEVLDLNHNELTYLPRSLGRLNGLRQLYLRGNRIRYISDSPLSSLQNLWVLDLGSNGLQEVWNDPLENLGSLVTLKLDNNMLTTIPQLDTRRTKIVSLSNNSLLCSCSLLRQVGHANIQIAETPTYGYSQSLSRQHNAVCENAYGPVLLDELKKWSERYESLCDQKGWGERATAALALWYHRNIDIMTSICKMMVVALVVVVLVAILRRRKKIMAKAKPQGIPYSMLDEQQVPTVSGSHSVP